ncbi:heparan sulfate 2-O-sulfotransferase 1 [Platysternon megacephalum]|uniref:Heparan sulfate 2-O-sulfotransferase 1 n=1 Tax=Platysternon megacephalum TaxID=55544 RepID=A0A4D9E8W4_9SAUR|nr:heparan sulfate 2-O-sulfotransferase 1 [Platysternon megacephalum]
MTAPQAPASCHQLREFDSVKDSIADLINQLQDIDPSRLSFSPFLDLDTQISLAPVSDSPESSVEELHSTSLSLATSDSPGPEVEPVEGMQSQGAGPLPGEDPRPSTVQGDPRLPVAMDSKDPILPLGCDPQETGWAGPGDSVVVAVPKETCFLDRVGAETPMVQHMEHLPSGREQPHSEGPARPTASRPLPREEQPFLGSGVVPVSCGPEEPAPRPPGKCCGCCTSSHLKAVSSVFVSLLLAPWVLYGLYYLLPFEPPLCPDLASRAAFALRCLLIAVVPSILGVMFGALAKLCSVAIDPLDTRSPPVLLHRLYIASSMEQFVIFGLNTVVLATFLAQEHLRLIPILAGLFSIGRCCYWISLHVGSAYRGFGFGLAFFPALAMTVYNLFCLYDLGFAFLFAPSPAGGGGGPTPAPPREPASQGT